MGMKPTNPSEFYSRHLIFDPIRKDAIIVNFDQIISLPVHSPTMPRPTLPYVRRSTILPVLFGNITTIYASGITLLG